jgi:hypothetical protein
MNIGIILPNLEPSQLAFETIYNLNEEIVAGSKHDYRIFFEDLSVRFMNPSCAIMNISEIWHFDGLLVTTTLNNTRLALKTTGNIQRVFYVWDLEWLRGQNDYLHNLSIYRNPNTLLLARSTEHAEAIYNYTNRKVNGVVSDLKLGELADAISTRHR